MEVAISYADLTNRCSGSIPPVSTCARTRHWSCSQQAADTNFKDGWRTGVRLRVVRWKPWLNQGQRFCFAAHGDPAKTRFRGERVHIPNIGLVFRRAAGAPLPPSAALSRVDRMFAKGTNFGAFPRPETTEARARTPIIAINAKAHQMAQYATASKDRRRRAAFRRRVPGPLEGSMLLYWEMSGIEREVWKRRRPGLRGV